MITFSPKHRIFLAISPIDFRCGIDGISRICKNKFKQDPLSGHYFIFRNKRKTATKILYFDSQGFCLFQKRFSNSKFQHWPSMQTELITLTPAQIQVLIEGGDPKLTKTNSPFRDIIDDT